ncbi:MAG: hypothetical protein EBS31_00320 [Burkholderiaceae bacterium]|nr:hypothetical protein [Burkholderiaceae bacterium]
MARFTGASGSGSGAPGPRGPEGDSAYDVAVANGFVGTEQEWLDSLSGGTANIADFIFTDNGGNSSITLPGDKGMRIEAGSDSDLYITAGDDLYIQTLGAGDDIHLNAADDIRFTTNNEDSAIEPIPTWRMTSEGLFELPGDGYISNPNAETVTPQTNVVTYYDNYLNDQSGLNQANAVLLPVDGNTLWFVGNNNITSPVTVTFADSTSTQLVAIYDATNQGTPAVVFQWNDQDRTKTYAETFPLTISADYNQITYGPSVIVLDPQWLGNDQKLVIDATAPNHIHVRAGGTIDASTADLILGGENTNVVVSDGQQSVVIKGDNGEFLHYVSANNQIATIGDISNATPVETSFTINGGALGTQPTFDGAPLFSGSYVKTGPLVHFQIQVDMDNILTFGSGQYYVDLPFNAKHGYDFREGCLHDISSSRQYAISGHVFAGTNRLFLSYTDSNGQDAVFDYNSPVLLDVADNFHISGTYIAD